MNAWFLSVIDTVFASPPPLAAAAGTPFYLDPEFWVAVAFVIFVGFMVWKARAALLGALDARAAKIERDIAEAQRLKDEAQALLAEYRQKQRAALGEAQGMLAQAEDEAKRMRAKAEAELAAQLQRRERQALDRIAQAEAQAVAEVRNLAADLTVAATAKLLKQRVEGERAKALTDAAIAEVPKRLQ